MKKGFAKSAMLLAVLIGFGSVSAQEKITVAASDSGAVDGLDLGAVGELFKNAENLEAFERSINDPDTGVNNLDLDGDGKVDFIRVVEEVNEGVHLIVLQAQLAENEFQDVATIEVEKTGEEQVNMQVHGNDVIYGPDYYVTVSDVHIHRWPIIAVIYRPLYHPYRSIFHFGYYPHWWRPYGPVAFHVYRTRTVKIVGRTPFTVTRTTRVRGVTRVHYVPRSSVRVKKSVTVVRPGGGAVHVEKKVVRPARIKHKRAN